MSGCTAIKTSGMDCLNHADREFVNCEGKEMRLCGSHDEKFYRLAIAAASIPDKQGWSEVDPATAAFMDALRTWTG